MDIDHLHIIHSGLSMALNEELDQYPNSMIGKVFLDKVYSIKHPLSGVKQTHHPNSNICVQLQTLEIYPQFVVNGSTREDALERSKSESQTVRNFLKVCICIFFDFTWFLMILHNFMVVDIRGER